MAKNSNAEFIIHSPVDVDGWPRRAKVYQDVDQFVAAIDTYIASGKDNCHVFTDEFGYIKSHFGSFERYPRLFKQFTSLTRHYGITAWIACQRPTLVHPDIRNNCAEIICFCLIGDSDRKAIQDISFIKDYEGLPLYQAIAGLEHKEAFVIRSSEKFLTKKLIGI